MAMNGLSIWSVKYGERVVRKNDVFHDYAQYGLPDGDLVMDYGDFSMKGTLVDLTLFDQPKPCTR